MALLGEYLREKFPCSPGFAGEVGGPVSVQGLGEASPPLAAGMRRLRTVDKSRGFSSWEARTWVSWRLRRLWGLCHGGRSPGSGVCLGRGRVGSRTLIGLLGARLGVLSVQDLVLGRTWV